MSKNFSLDNAKLTSMHNVSSPHVCLLINLEDSSLYYRSYHDIDATL